MVALSLCALVLLSTSSVVLTARAASATNYWWVGASSRDASALPNQGVSSTNGLCDYMIKTTAWSSGALGFSSYNCAKGVVCYASFQAKGVIQVMDSVTGAVLLSQGNIQISVGAWDNTGTSNNGGVDQITISAVYPQPVGGVTSHQVGTVAYPISIKGGNIVVHPK